MTFITYITCTTEISHQVKSCAPVFSDKAIFVGVRRAERFTALAYFPEENIARDGKVFPLSFSVSLFTFINVTLMAPKYTTSRMLNNGELIIVG